MSSSTTTFWCHKCNKVVDISEPDQNDPKCPSCNDCFVEKYNCGPSIPAFRDSRQYQRQRMSDIQRAQLARAQDLRQQHIQQTASVSAAASTSESASATNATSAATANSETEEPSTPMSPAATAPTPSISAREVTAGRRGGSGDVVVRHINGPQGFHQFMSRIFGLTIPDETESGADEAAAGDGNDNSPQAARAHAMLTSLLRRLASGDMEGALPLLLGIPPGASPGDYASDSQMADILQQMLQSDFGGGAPPLSESKKSQLPRITLTEGHASVGKECPVCQENVAVGDTVCTLPCDHLFHDACITPWLAQRSTCPLCRFDIEKNQPAS